MAANVTVMGYGAVGRETVKLLVDRGDRVRVAQRSHPRDLPLAVEFAPTDVLNSESVLNACMGSEAVICCIGFPYDSRIWQKNWPKAMTNLLAACEKAKARFIFADNLYMYGPQTAPLTEDMPLTDFGRKPRLRAEITRLWQAAHHDGRVQAVAVRASDFYGPDVPTSVISAYGVKNLLAGKAAVMAQFSTLLLNSSMVDDDFEWNAAKARKNYRDHGVTFETAKRAFSDPFAIALIDEREDYGEERCNLLGMAEGQLLNVAYAEREGRIRLISARRATKKEKDDYFTQNTQG